MRVMRVIGVALLAIGVLGVVGMAHIRSLDRARTWGHCWDDFSGGGVDYEFVAEVLNGVEQAWREHQPHGKVMTAGAPQLKPIPIEDRGRD